MKVLHIISNLAHNHGGLSFELKEMLASETAQGNNEIHVIADSKEGLNEAGNIKVHTITEGPDKSNQTQIIYDRVKPDIVVFWRPEHTKQFYPFLKKLDVPLAIKTSSTFDMEGMLPTRQEAYKLCFDLVKEKKARVIANSEHNARWNHEHFHVPNELQQVIRTGVDLALDMTPPTITRETLGIPKDAFVVSNITRATARDGKTHHIVTNYAKDPFGFILAAAHLSKKYPDAVFVMCGDGANKEYAAMKRLIARANEESGGRLTPDNFKTLGYVTPIDDIYKLSDVVMSTSHSEAFGRTVAEAMKYGVPSIVADTGAMPEMNGHISHAVPGRHFSYGSQHKYFASKDSNSRWLSHVEKAFTDLYERDAPQREHDEAYLKERVKLYDIDAVAKRHLELYQQLVDEKGKGSAPTRGVPPRP